MSKRNVTFSKPTEPTFLRKLKEQVGYKEGPTIETKREALERATEEDVEDTVEEQPTVVVLQPGDLSAEEAAQAKEQLQKKTEEAKADLNAPIVFKAPSKDKKVEKSDQKALKRPPSPTDNKKKVKKQKNKSLLSFDEEENDD